MKVVWASHRSWQPQVLGGAERADRTMLATRPGDLEITLVAPGFSDSPESRQAVEDADRIIVSGLRFPPDELRMFADFRTVAWIHDVEYLGHPMLDFASDVICMTPWHAALEEAQIKSLPERSWLGPRMHVNPGWFDTSPFQRFPTPAEERGWTALWAHRPAWHKNMQGASAWCEAKGVTLRVMLTRPREEVIEAMFSSRYFVLLSLIDDPGPWAVIESQLAGCIPIVNERVGWYENDTREELLERIDQGAERFWSVIRDI